MRTIDADLFKNNVKAWAENIRNFRSDNKCFFTEDNILKAIDDQPTIEDIQKAIGKQMLSPEIDSTIVHAMTHEDTEILGMFCDFSGIHGEDLKKLLIRGYLKNVPKSETMGNWRRILIRNDKGGCVGARMICPVCNADNKHDEYMRYCPNCGARLEKNIGNSGEEHFFD